MRGPAFGILGIALSVSALAACTSTPEDTIEPPNSAGGEITGGEIIVGGDLNDDAPIETTSLTVEPPAPATSSTTEPAASTVAPNPATTRATTPATTPAITAQPTTTEAEVVGDGPVLTSPGTDGTSEAPGVGLVPAFFALEATPTVDCTAANPGTVQLRWEVIGSETVDIAIGTATQIFRLAQPPAGTLDVPLDCAEGSTYFVVASNAEGSTTRSVHLAADAAA